jgi:hypothetical protein
MIDSITELALETTAVGELVITVDEADATDETEEEDDEEEEEAELSADSTAASIFFSSR